MDFDHSLLRTRSVFQSCYKFMPARFVIAGWFAVRGGIYWTVSLTKNISRNSFVARCDLLVAFSPAGYAPPVRALAC